MIDLRDVQGNILNGYKLEHARYVFLRLPSDHAVAHGVLARIAPSVTTAARDTELTSAVNVAITHAGFHALGLPSAVCDGFPDVFRTAPVERADDLGDRGPSDPRTWDQHVGTGETHLLLTLHGSDVGDLDASVAALTEGCEVLHDQPAHQLPYQREHFGYADGGAQPDIEGVPPHRPGGGVPLPDGSWRPVRLGEFVLGHRDEDGDIATRPDGDLVRNGSYLVYRKLAQDVAGFRQALAGWSARTGADPELTAARVVGRWRDGLPLVSYPNRVVGDLTHCAVQAPNDFRYLPDDRLGAACPRGAHVRRVNPRDSLDFDGAVRAGGELTARHRIIRRGMPYGEELPADADDGAERGLVFVAYNADIARQFETVQRQWCNDGDVFGLGADRDPLFAVEGGKHTVPRNGAPPLFLPAWSNLVRTRGTEYAFAPGIAALAALAEGRFS